MAEVKRITRKEVTLGGQNFVIKKMDARLASYVAFQMKNFVSFGADDSELGEAVSKAQSTMSRRDFYALQNDCLSVCYHVMPAGETPVLAPDNQFISEELSQDPKTVVLLTLSALAFNVMDFFDEGFLKGLGALMSDIMPSIVKMSRTSSSPQSSPDTGSNTKHGTGRTT